MPLLIQQNLDGSDFFNRSWAEFKVGFNDTSGNYWLGNDLLHSVTQDGHYAALFVLRARANAMIYTAEAGTFIVGDEESNYRLRVGIIPQQCGM